MLSPNTPLPNKPESPAPIQEMGVIVYHGMRAKDLSYLLVDSETMAWVLYGRPHATDAGNDEEADDADEAEDDGDNNEDDIDGRASNAPGESFYNLQSLLAHVVENNIRVATEYIAST